MSATAHRVSGSQKAARRSPNTWRDGHPQRPTTRRLAPTPSEPTVLRFPLSQASMPRSARENAVNRRLASVQSAWSTREREQRRIQAIRKQEELLMLMADAELEDVLRMAVADGEQPVYPPEIEALRN